MEHACLPKQTPRKLFMLYRTENQCFTTFSNFKHGYTKKFYWSSHIFHWSSHFFIGRGPRTDKFRGVCPNTPCFNMLTLRGLNITAMFQRHLHMYFHERKCLNFDRNYIEDIYTYGTPNVLTHSGPVMHMYNVHK